jgi:hypothetical protein
MRNMSGALQSQLGATLRYLGLVNAVGQPTDRLSRIVNSEGAERSTALRDVAKAAYPFLFHEFDLRSATPKMMADKFAAMNASGGTIGKCMAFFISLAKEAEIPLAPHLLVTRGNRSGKPRRLKIEPQSTPLVNGMDTNLTPSEVASMPWKQLLLSKFPSFDPTWPDEVKNKWFDGFHRLMRQGPEDK